MGSVVLDERRAFRTVFVKKNYNRAFLTKQITNCSLTEVLMCNVEGKSERDTRNCTFEMRGQRRIKTKLVHPVFLENGPVNVPGVKEMFVSPYRENN